MVRPFFRWMVSARAPRAGARQSTRKVTRGRIQAHSSNRGASNLRDEGTKEKPSNADGGSLSCAVGMACACGGRFAAKTGGDTLSTAGQSGTGPRSGVPGEGRGFEPARGTNQFGRRDDRIHAGCAGTHHGGVLRGRRGSADYTSYGSRAALDEPIHRDGDSGGAIFDSLLAVQR